MYVDTVRSVGRRCLHQKPWLSFDLQPPELLQILKEIEHRLVIKTVISIASTVRGLRVLANSSFSSSIHCRETVSNVRCLLFITMRLSSNYKRPRFLCVCLVMQACSPSFTTCFTTSFTTYYYYSFGANPEVGEAAHKGLPLSPLQ